MVENRESPHVPGSTLYPVPSTLYPLFIDGAADDAAFGMLDEVKDQVTLRTGLVFGFDGLQGVGVVEAAGVEGAIDVLNEVDLLIGESAST